jgi:hypothetical protein
MVRFWSLGVIQKIRDTQGRWVDEMSHIQFLHFKTNTFHEKQL